MTKTRLLLALFAVLLFAACMHNAAPLIPPDITSDTLHYTYQEVKQKANDCGNKPDTGCTVAKITYPVFASQSKLNDTVVAKLLNLFSPNNHPDKDLETQAKNFIAGYEQFKTQEKGRNIVFTLNSNAKILRQDSSFITIEISGYNFAGGAHGSSLTFFINWNTKAKKSITLDDLFNANYKQPLTAIAEKIFRKDENLKDSSSLARDYFFKGNQFALNNNFVITPIGIRFLYNQYEIKPYAAGITDLFIPYSQIKKLLKPNTVIAQYIK
jgi:hypothetical protein